MASIPDVEFRAAPLNAIEGEMLSIDTKSNATSRATPATALAATSFMVIDATLA